MLKNAEAYVDEDLPTFFFQEDAAFCNHDRNVAVNVALALIVKEGNGNVGVTDRGVQRDAKNARCCCCVHVSHCFERRDKCAMAQRLVEHLKVHLHTTRWCDA